MYKGKLTGIGYHLEYHYDMYNKNDECRTDCIYIDKNRICLNSKSCDYNSKCFVATHCPWRIKKGENKHLNENTEHNIKNKTKITKHEINEIYKVFYGDMVLLKIKGEEDAISITIDKKSLDDMPPVYKMCFGKSKGYVFIYNDFEYTIINIQKGSKKSNDRN